MLTLTTIGSLYSKEKKGVIMTVDGEEIPTEEFLYLFNKNNSQLQQSQSLDEYLKLFEIYRLKVAEAKNEGVDTTVAFKKEIRQYRRELLEPYIADTAFINALVDVAAQRDKEMVESSHIMIIRTHDEEKDKHNLVLIDSLRNELLNGADFIELAKKYSEDNFSSQKGGYLGFTPAGTFPYAFETAVYETPEGEISEIVESHVGWHIVKVGSRKPASEFNQPERPVEVIREEVLRKASSPFDSRFFDIRNNTIRRLKAKHPKLALAVDSLPTEEAYEILVVAEEEAQYKENADYRNLVDEYTNGSLLYEVSVRNIWDKAPNDEEGLNNFYLQHKEDYKWDTPHAKGVLIQALNDSVSQLVKNAVIGLDSDEIVKTVREDFKKVATADKFNLPQGINPMVDNVMFGQEPSSPKIKSFTEYFILNGRIVPQPEDVNDVKSSVIADYQEQLEQQWVKDLKERHNVMVNQKELSKIKKALK